MFHARIGGLGGENDGHEQRVGIAIFEIGARFRIGFAEAPERFPRGVFASTGRGLRRFRDTFSRCLAGLFRLAFLRLLPGAPGISGVGEGAPVAAVSPPGARGAAFRLG